MLATQHKVCICCVFDPLHHTYMAMYLMFALGFIYSELAFHRSEMPGWFKWILAVVAALLVTYTLFVNSRTGTAGLIALALAVVAHWMFRLKQWKRGFALLAVVLAVGTGIHFALPECARRLTQTISEMNEGDTSDARYLIFGSSMKAISENGAFGVGLGDKNDVLDEVYEETGEAYAVEAQYNSHNIYLDSMLTMGVPGLVLLLALLGVPAFMAWRRRDFIAMSLLFSFAFSGLFEARLAHEEMPGKENHVFAPAFRAEDMPELLRVVNHIVFNSPRQVEKFGEMEMFSDACGAVHKPVTALDQKNETCNKQ